MKDLIKSIPVRILSASLLIALLIIFSGTYTLRLLSRDASTLVQIIAESERSMRAGNWSNAASSTENAESKWKGMKSSWSMLIDHQEIDNIDITMARLHYYILSKELPGSMAETAALKEYVGHIPDRERLSLKNVL